MQTKLIPLVAHVGESDLRGPARAIVLRFSGLGSAGLKAGLDDIEQDWAKAGALVVTPYHDPWAWMNPQTVSFVDELVSALQEKYGSGRALPVVSTGGSMGGHAALAYAFLSRQKILGVEAICPVCDLPFHYTERVDLPRTMHHAFGSYGDISGPLLATSPLHQVARLPAIPYLIIHGVRDPLVRKDRHSDPLVTAMRARGLSVQYVESEVMEHCSPWDDTLRQAAREFVLKLMPDPA